MKTRYTIPESISETIAIVKGIDNAQDAIAFYDSYVAHEVAKGRHEDHAAGTARHNIGCCFDYGKMSEDRIAMWGEVTGAERVDMDAFAREVMALPGIIRAAEIRESKIAALPWYWRWPIRAWDWLRDTWDGVRSH